MGGPKAQSEVGQDLTRVEAAKTAVYDCKTAGVGIGEAWSEGADDLTGGVFLLTESSLEEAIAQEKDF